MNNKKLTIFIASLSALAACTPHLSKNQCIATNWYQLGFADGSAGQAKRDLAKDVSDCARFNIEVNVKPYASGWRKGVREFCSPDNAYQLGVRGQANPQLCPADLSKQFARSWRRGIRKYCVPQTGYNLGRNGQGLPQFCPPGQFVAFNNAYQDGKRVFKREQSLKSQIATVSSSISSNNYDIDNNNRKIDDLNRQLTYSSLSSTQRDTLNRQIRDLNKQNKTLQITNGILLVEKVALQNKLSSVG